MACANLHSHFGYLPFVEALCGHLNPAISATSLHCPLMFDLQSDESEGEPKRNQRAKAPKPMDFPVAQLQAGQKAWHAGGDGGMVTFADLGCSAREVPKKEVLLLGKVLFGRQRFAFEVQVLDHTPAAVKKILKKAREIEEERFGSL